MRTAVVFPGQGSQRPGMGQPWRAHPAWQLVERAGTELGTDVGALLLDADAETLRATAHAQLTTFVASQLAWSAVQEHVQPVAVAGHSLGEFTALAAGGALSWEAGLHLVAARGACMQAAADARPGTMAAVLGLEADDVSRVCAGIEDLWPANDNAPRHVVVAGTTGAVAASREVLTAAGARRVLPLPVGGAFHTPLMAPARPRLETALQQVDWAVPELAVLSAVDLEPYADHPAATLSRQLTAPVRWRELCLRLGELGVERVVEVGPGGVLAGLVARCLPGVQTVSVATPDEAASLA